MAKGWYILHTYAGYENKIERILHRYLENGDLDPAVVTDIKIPREEVVEVKDGKKKITTRLILPSYILIEMDLPYEDSGWKPVCSAIRKIQGVTGFVGTASKDRPQPISADEARSLLEKSGDIKGTTSARPRIAFNVGEEVKIVDGPFASFSGNIEEVNLEKNKLKVMVGIFGRATPVEVDLFQVEKI